MARRRNGSVFGTLVILAVLGLAVFGGYTVYKMKSVQDTSHSVERAAKAAKAAW